MQSVSVVRVVKGDFVGRYPRATVFMIHFAREHASGCLTHAS